MKRILFSIAILLAFSNVGFCDSNPTQGQLGETSQGIVDISATIPSLVLINGLDNITFPTITASSVTTDGSSVTENFCVTTNLYSTEKYTVVATGSGTSNAFTLATTTAEKSDTIAYKVYYNTQKDTKGSTELDVGGNGKNFDADGNGFQDTCNNPNANVTLEISKDTLHGAKHGTYTGTLTLVVSPAAS